MILAAYMVPHPPMIVPAVGRGSQSQIEATTNAYKKVAQEIADLKPETIIISSPHATMYADYFHISPGQKASGSFANFRAPEVSFKEEYDTELVKTLEALAEEEDFPAGTLGERERSLDHGTMVPLYFIREKYQGARIVRIGLSGLPLVDHYRLGQMISEAVRISGRRAVYIASGDLSHKLQIYGPYGYAPEGPLYDKRIMEVCSKGDFGQLFDFDEAFCEKAAECGHRSFVIMAGALDGLEVEAEQLSHEDVTGVGYGICTFHPMNSEDDKGSDFVRASQTVQLGNQASGQLCQKKSNHFKADSSDRRFLDQYLKKKETEMEKKRADEDAYVRLARNTIECYIRFGEVIQIPSALPEELKTTKAGAFVSIHEHGRLRGCIGTILPTQGCLAEEIIRNAISASVRDPRFDPIQEEELPWLEINVDVLGEPEEIATVEELDVKKYGVIVSCGRKRGLLLPDLSGVDTVEQQVSIARQKGGIREGEKIRLERFEVVRHL
ncbi:MAG: AmmeMemoRadiSam system protein A [Eubacterium sp.]|nr:AmmeMemoRadiSam system protein A [Eubacterium sp.]